MNRDHVFLHTLRKNNKICRISAYRTDRLGHPIEAYSTAVASPKDNSSEYQSLTNAMSDLVSVLRLHDCPLVIVSPNPVQDKVDYRNAFVVGDSRWLDLFALAWPLVMQDVVSENCTFKELCAVFGIEIRGDGAGECVAIGELYWRMMTRYKTSLYGEEMVRKAGGKALATVRGLFGV